MNKILPILLTLISLSVFASNNPKKDVKKNNNAPFQLNDDIILDIMQSIPSPIEIASLVKEVGSGYNKSSLNNLSSVSKYNTNYKKALNLGVYGTDLGFANLYNKKQDALSYLNSVQKIANGLSIGQFFDFATMKDLANKESLDELMTSTTKNFEGITQHLSKQNREFLSILMLTGGWVEALYLTTQMYEKNQDPKLKDKIAEQKVALEQIMLVLDVYKTKPQFPNLINNLTDLQDAYSHVEFESSGDAGTQTEVDDQGNVTFTSTGNSTIKVSDTDFNSIVTSIKKIRGELIQ